MPHLSRHRVYTKGDGMTRYYKCLWCGKTRMMKQVHDGVRTRICFACFKMQQYLPDLKKKKKAVE